MKIVCLTRGRAHHNYFVNEIHRHHPVSLLVVETPRAESKLRQNIQDRGIVGVAKLALNHFIFNRSSHDALNAEYGDKWKMISEGIDEIKVPHINDDVVVNALNEIQPDVILDHGTSIVNNRVLETAKLCLNLHWGLSPYYRGTSCTEWAIINRDPYNIGVTIHRLAKEIDGGDIAAQCRTDVLPEDDIHSINLRSTRLGTELLIEILDRLVSGTTLEFFKQDSSLGFLYLNRHIDQRLRDYVKCLENNQSIAAMLKKPARKERLPIVEL